MDVRIETPQGRKALTEFIRFYDQVYEYKDARWPAALELQLPILSGDSPFADGRTMRPFLARAGSKLLARAVAVIDERYNRHWQERLGHVIMFEATPESRDATRLVMDAACEWLKEQGAEADPYG